MKTLCSLTVIACGIMSIGAVSAQMLTKRVPGNRQVRGSIGCCTALTDEFKESRVNIDTMRTMGNFSKDYLYFPAVRDFRGGFVSSESLKGSNVLYVFSSTMCVPCIALSKALSEVIEEKWYEDENLKFVYVNILLRKEKQNQRTLSEIPDKLRLELDHLIVLPPAQWKKIGLLSGFTPTYILVDTNGKVAYKGVGFVHESDVAIPFFYRLIGRHIDTLLENEKAVYWFYQPQWMRH